MPTPRALHVLPDGQRFDPTVVDAVPSDWETVDYDIKLRAHPDLPGVAILKFVLAGTSGGSSPTYAYLYLTGIEGATGNTVIIADETGAPITAYTPV
jgi:hypothetical protein